MDADTSSFPRWKQIAKVKQNHRESLVAQWSQKILGMETPRLPPPQTKYVRDWPARSGHLDPEQIKITSSTPSKILRMIAARAWTAEKVLIAFTIRATIAHHLTNPLSDVFFERALMRARELDQILHETGHTVGPLHGLPLSLKDVMNIKGYATNFGFVAMSENIQHSSDDLVTHLLEAGAIFFCKTNVPQSLMSGECNNWLYGRTSTPDNRLLSAGGSSGGEGSLIALRGSPLGIGTDIAGSIRTPANFNGIYGLCPTYGRFPCHSANGSTIGLINGVAGPLSASIDGLELYARTVLSFEPWRWDATCLNLPWDEGAYLRTKELAANGRLCFGFIPNDGVVRPHCPIQRGLRETKDALVKGGHQVVDVDLFQKDDNFWDLAKTIFCADGGQALRDTLDIIPEPPVEEILVPPASMSLTATELEKKSKSLLDIRHKILKRWQETVSLTRTGRPVDVFIMPSGGHVAAPHGTMEYFLYEAISNIIDWPCATIPINNVDLTLDARPDRDETYVPLSEDDRRNWKKYNPESYDNGAICLQVLGPRFNEEVVLASMRVVDESLGRGPDYLA